MAKKVDREVIIERLKREALSDPHTGWLSDLARKGLDWSESDEVIMLRHVDGSVDVGHLAGIVEHLIAEQAAVLPEVSSIEELDALPAGAVILPLAYHNAISVVVRDQCGTWAAAGHPSPYVTEAVFLGLHGKPARVLYRPAEKEEI